MPQKNANGLTFEDLRDHLVASVGSAVEIATADIAGGLTGVLADYLGLTTLRLENVRLLEQGEAAVRVAGPVRLSAGGNRKIEIGVDARFTRARSGIGYTVIFAVTPSATKAMLGDLARVLDALPVEMSGMWVALSSETQGTIHVHTPGHELGEAVIEAGHSYMFRLGGSLLNSLKLDRTIFYLANFPGALNFNTRTRIVLPIGPLLQVTVRSIGIEGAQAIRFAGEGVFDFFGQKLEIPADVRVSTAGVAFQIGLGRFIPKIDAPLFKFLVLDRVIASVDGSLAGYAVGVEGDFAIAGSGNTGRFLVKYSSGPSNGIPDLFELKSSRLTLSDVATLASGFEVRLPQSIDRVIELRETYIYTAQKPGMITMSGVPSEVGIKAYSNVTLLGYKTYGEVEAVAGRFAARFQFAPIKLGNIIEISGSGAGSPRGFSGNNVGKNAIMVEVDSRNHSAAASLKVRLFGQSTIDVVGKLNDRSMDFVIKAKLPQPLGETGFSAAMANDTATLRARVQMEVSVKADWGSGKFSINKAAKVEADLKIEARPGSATGRADVRASLGPVQLAFPLDFDPLDVNGLVEKIQREVEKQIVAALENAVKWLEAILDETIEFFEDSARLAAAIGFELNRRFGKSAEQAAAALRDAGYDINNAYLVLENGFGAGYENIRDLLQVAGGFAERAVLDWMREIGKADVAKFTAHTVADFMMRAGYGTEKAIAEIHDMLRDTKLTAEVMGQLVRSPKEVAKFLFKAGVSVGHAAEYLAEGFALLTKEALKDTLTAVGFPAKQVGPVLETVWRESGRALENIRDELGRGWKKYTRPTIRWRVTW